MPVVNVNRTDSAVRLTYLLKDDGGTEHTVVTVSDDEANQNKDKAMKMLQAKVYELEMQRATRKAGTGKQQGGYWLGQPIRSYVLDDAYQGLRTGVENRNTQAVLDGALDPFMKPP